MVTQPLQCNEPDFIAMVNNPLWAIEFLTAISRIQDDH